MSKCSLAIGLLLSLCILPTGNCAAEVNGDSLYLWEAYFSSDWWYFNDISEERSALLFQQSGICDQSDPPFTRFAIADSVVCSCLKSTYYVLFIKLGGRGQPAPIHRWFAKDNETQQVLGFANSLELEEYIGRDFKGNGIVNAASARNCVIQIATIVSPYLPVMFPDHPGQLAKAMNALWSMRLYEKASHDDSLFLLIGSVAFSDGKLGILASYSDTTGKINREEHRVDSLAASVYTYLNHNGAYEFSLGSWSRSGGLVLHWNICVSRQGILRIDWTEIGRLQTEPGLGYWR